MREQLFSTMKLCVLNNSSVTSIHPAKGSTSALNLSVCGPSLLLDYEWSRHDDMCGSDDFPVILTATGDDEDPSLNRWNLGGADMQSRLTEEAGLSVEDPASTFTSLLIEAAEVSIPLKKSRRFHGLMNYANKP